MIKNGKKGNQKAWQTYRELIKQSLNFRIWIQ